MQNRYWSIIYLLALQGALAVPLIPPSDSESDSDRDSTTTEKETLSENRPKDLYVIRKVVYEIGILTDADNSTEYDNKTHEQIDVSFFDPIDNGTFIDLSNIPVPVETNVSGIAITGILPTNFGSLVFPQNGTEASLNESNFALFPHKQVRVTKNISTQDKDQSANILSGISDVLGLSKLVAPLSQERDEKLSK